MLGFLGLESWENGLFVMGVWGLVSLKFLLLFVVKICLFVLVEIFLRLIVVMLVVLLMGVLRFVVVICDVVVLRELVCCGWILFVKGVFVWGVGVRLVVVDYVVFVCLVGVFCGVFWVFWLGVGSGMIRYIRLMFNVSLYVKLL